MAVGTRAATSVSASPAAPVTILILERKAYPRSINTSSWSTSSASTAAATQPNSTNTQFCVWRPAKM